MSIFLFLLLNIIINCSSLFAKEKTPSVTTTTFYIMRHGQTDWNKEKRKQGQINTQLNNEGKKESTYLSMNLKDVIFDYCYSSDLDRARETAEIVLADRSISINYDTRLRERSYGHWEGILTSDYDTASPKEKLDVETDAAVQQRVFALLRQISKDCPGKTILISTHAGVIRNIIAQLINYNKNTKDICVNTAGFMVLEYINGNWSIKELNKISEPTNTTRSP